MSQTHHDQSKFYLIFFQLTVTRLRLFIIIYTFEFNHKKVNFWQHRQSFKIKQHELIKIHLINRKATTNKQLKMEYDLDTLIKKDKQEQKSKRKVEKQKRLGDQRNNRVKYQRFRRQRQYSNRRNKYERNEGLYYPERRYESRFERKQRIYRKQNRQRKRYQSREQTSYDLKGIIKTDPSLQKDKIEKPFDQKRQKQVIINKDTEMKAQSRLMKKKNIEERIRLVKKNNESFPLKIMGFSSDVSIKDLLNLINLRETTQIKTIFKRKQNQTANDGQMEVIIVFKFKCDADDFIKSFDNKMFQDQFLTFQFRKSKQEKCQKQL